MVERAAVQARPGSKLAAIVEAREALVAEAEGLIEADGSIKPENEAKYEDLTSKASKLAAQRDQLAATYEDSANSRVVMSWNGSGQETEQKADGSFQVKEHAEDKPWASMGEQLQAIAQAMSPHGPRDPRLMAAASGGSVGEAAGGGFFMQTEYSNALLDKAREESPILGMCRQIPIAEGTESLELNIIDETSRATGSRWGGVQVYRRAEAETVTASRPKFAKLKIDTSEIMGIAYMTEKLLRNAPAMEAIYGDAFASEFAFKVTDEIIRGGGGDECLGIITATNAAKISQAKETGQAADTVVWNNLSKMHARLPARSKGRYVVLYNGELEPQFDAMTVPAGTAALEPRFLSYNQQGVLTFKGRPMMAVEQCSAPGDEGDIIFADFNEYIISPQGGVNGQSSMHVRFLYSEMTFRWTYTINGRPAVLSAVTPFKGANTLSPFVTLAERA